tara:strand:+ start:1081 stop:1332 length:252 start_codon:yes stop_codon:yes gene_type:complete
LDSETPEQRLARQLKGIDMSSAKGQEIANGLRRRHKAKELDAKDAAVGKTQGTKTNPDGTTSAPAAIPHDAAAERQAKRDAEK